MSSDARIRALAKRAGDLDLDAARQLLREIERRTDRKTIFVQADWGDEAGPIYEIECSVDVEPSDLLRILGGVIQAWVDENMRDEDSLTWEEAIDSVPSERFEAAGVKVLREFSVDLVLPWEESDEGRFYAET